MFPVIVTVTSAGLIVSFSVPVTYPKQSSLDTLTFTVLLSDTSFAVISSRFVVHLPSAFWYSTVSFPISFSLSALATAVASPAAWDWPLYVSVTSFVVNVT